MTSTTHFERDGERGLKVQNVRHFQPNQRVDFVKNPRRCIARTGENWSAIAATAIVDGGGGSGSGSGCCCRVAFENIAS